MKISLERHDDIAIIHLSGEIDSRGNQQLDTMLKALIDESCFFIILDLADIRFLGSQVVSLLLSNMKDLRANYGDICFLNPQRSLVNALKENKITEIFKIFSIRTEAMRSFNTNRQQQAISFSDVGVSNTGTAEIPLDTFVSSISESKQSVESGRDIQAQFETGEILYTNSCMIASLIKTLENKGIITSNEANDLLNDEHLSIKGVQK